MSNNLEWYIIRSISGQEKKIKDYLEKEIVNYGLGDYLTEILIPSRKVSQVRKMKGGKTKKITVDKNYFPGYVMIKADLGYGELMHIVQGVPGIIGFLMVDGKESDQRPKPMRESEINRILGRVNETEDFEETDDTTYLKGEGVKVVDGPFDGFTGVIEEVFEDKKKLSVMVKILGRNTPVELNYAQVEKVE